MTETDWRRGRKREGTGRGGGRGETWKCFGEVFC